MQLNHSLTVALVRASIQGVLREGLIAACLTVIMILLFLGNWKSTLIILVSIPLPFSSAFFPQRARRNHQHHDSRRLALAVGILVDDATVEIENINRNLAMGKDTIQAILDGAQQIAVPRSFPLSASASFSSQCSFFPASQGFCSSSRRSR